MKILLKISKSMIVIVASFASFVSSVHASPQIEENAEFVHVSRQNYDQDDQVRAPDDQSATETQYASKRINEGYGTGVSGSTQTRKYREMTVSTYSPPIVIIDR